MCMNVYVCPHLCLADVWKALYPFFVWMSLGLFFCLTFFTLLPPACFFIESEEFLSRFLFYQSFCFYWQKQVSICAVLVQSRGQE